MTNTKIQRWGIASFIILTGIDAPFIVTVAGGDRWVLECLSRAWVRGCAPINEPAPMWPRCVLDLCQLSGDAEEGPAGA